MKKIFYLLLIITLTTCNKTEKMKNKLFPVRSYENAQIDKFYWADSGWDYAMIPLIKPYILKQLQGSDVWMLETHTLNKKIEKFHGKETILFGFDPVENINVSSIYIYGTQGDRVNETGDLFPKIWFIINTKNHEVKGFEVESDFKIELKKLNLPEEMLSPDAVYEQFKNDPVLPWFPEDIKKQLEAAKK